jgi:uncharacterized protein (TIGR04141 family)
MSKEKKNKLSIYLIKKGIPQNETIVEDASLRTREIEGSTLAVRPSATKRPAWIGDFFGLTLAGDDSIFSSVPSVALIVPINLGKKGIRRFAITFGAGFHLLRKGVFEQHFGLRIVLNSVDQKNIRMIDKTSLGALVKQSREQAGRSAETSEFGIDIEQDLIQAVSGLSKEKGFGKTISGKDSFHISVPTTFKDLNELLKLCLKYFNSDEYKKSNFSWIDNIEEIRDARKIAELDTKLVEKINGDNFEKIWMAIPEIIDWSDFECFKYRKSAKAEKYRDLMFQDFIKEREEHKGTFTIELLNKYEAYCFFETTPEKSWRIYDCIYAEISEGDRIYTLTNGKWYQINKDFSKDVEKEFKRILSEKPSLQLPKCPVRKEKITEPVIENEYNEYAAKKGEFALLHGKDVMHSGSRIEVCDLYSLNKEFIHVKKYGGSNVLSHLFNQGIVSAELFSSHDSFRKEMNKRLPPEYRILNPEQPINPTEYKVVFGIISSSKKDLDIPFFSKVSLRNSFMRLKLYRYSVFIQKIDVDDRIKIKAKRAVNK